MRVERRSRSSRDPWSEALECRADQRPRNGRAAPGGKPAKSSVTGMHSGGHEPRGSGSRNCWRNIFLHINTLCRLSLLPILSLASLANAQNKAPALPKIPEILKDLKPALSLAYGAITLNITSPQPLTPAQWDAITALHPKRLFFSG